MVRAAILKSMRKDSRFDSCLVEIKVSKNATLPSTALKEHQRHALRIATESAMYFKIPDAGYQNPVDAFIMKKAQSYLVVYYEKPAVECWAVPIQNVPEGSMHIDHARGGGLRVELST